MPISRLISGKKGVKISNLIYLINNACMKIFLINPISYITSSHTFIIKIIHILALIIRYHPIIQFFRWFLDIFSKKIYRISRNNNNNKQQQQPFAVQSRVSSFEYCLKGNNFCPDQPSNTALSDRATSVYARCKDFSGLCWLVFPSPFLPLVRCARRSRELIPRQKGHRVSIAYSLWRGGRYLLAAHSTTIRARVYSRARPKMLVA